MQEVHEAAVADDVLQPLKSKPSLGNGKGEIARRKRQIAAGQLKVDGHLHEGRFVAGKRSHHAAKVA